MTNAPFAANAEGLSKSSPAFNLSKIMQQAWQAYRMTRMGVFLPTDASGRRAFLPAMFAKCLRAAWADVRKRAGWVAPVAVLIKAKPVATIPSRSAAIRAELDQMQYRDFIDWNAHRALSAELAQTGA